MATGVDALMDELKAYRFNATHPHQGSVLEAAMQNALKGHGEAGIFTLMVVPEGLNVVLGSGFSVGRPTKLGKRSRPGRGLLPAASITQG